VRFVPTDGVTSSVIEAARTRARLPSVGVGVESLGGTSFDARRLRYSDANQSEEPVVSLPMLAHRAQLDPTRVAGRVQLH